MATKKKKKGSKPTIRYNGKIEKKPLRESLYSLSQLSIEDERELNAARERISMLLPPKSYERRKQIENRRFFDLVKLFLKQKQQEKEKYSQLLEGFGATIGDEDGDEPN